MNSTATHDSKRGEDVRARLNVLSEIPAEWAANLEQWQALNRSLKAELDGREVPDKNEEYFLYQTLVGAFPLGDYDLTDFIDRLGKYMVKAAREAKIHTSWLSPNEAHEAALTAFVERILAPSGENSFLDTLLPFCKKIARYGIYNSLSQTMIKITAPGVPDIYQGTELMDLNLVDPDNRRAVDFVSRLKYLQKIKTGARIEIRSLIDELMADRFDGRLKLYVIAAALKTRKAYSRLYRDGDYVALQTTGRFHNHVVAFARRDGYNWSISAVPRLLTDLVGEDEDPIGSAVWQDTAIDLPDGAPVRWHNVLTDEVLTAKNTLALRDVLALFPAALLIGE
jgi:(1->4)-alpha-D-glucan 1-alpha-D-glucosylmutase